MNRPKLRTIAIFVVAIALTFLATRWWSSRSTIYLGTIDAAGTSAPVKVTEQLSVAITQYPKTVKFQIKYYTDHLSSHVITYDRQSKSLIDEQEIQRRKGGLSFSQVTDDKIHALARSASPYWDLNKYGCAAAAWEN